jgi:hypothetical protein
VIEVFSPSSCHVTDRGTDVSPSLTIARTDRVDIAIVIGHADVVPGGIVRRDWGGMAHATLNIPFGYLVALAVAIVAEGLVFSIVILVMLTLLVYGLRHFTEIGIGGP